MTKLIESIQDIKAALSQNKWSTKPIGLVPTMGALHAGHISLIKLAREECKTVVVYIFVNPLQFAKDEDLKEYPRDLQTDLKICEENNIDYVFVPSEKEIYPDINNINKQKTLPPNNLAGILCGKTRVEHFSGVTTVLKRFLEIIEPDFVYFGEKDLQQVYIVRWLIGEYKFPILLRSCPIIRESNGLAYSSRNKYLTNFQKDIASALYKALKLAKENTRSGIFTVSKSTLESLIFLSQFAEIKVEYFEARGKTNLEKVSDDQKKGFYYLIAAKVANVRLIDNIEV